MSNVRDGNYRSTRASSMKAFDRLPPEVRQALANAVDDWATQPLLTFLRRDLGPSTVVSLIRRWDRSELAHRERDRAAARGVYSGNRPDANTGRPARRKNGRRT